MKHFFPDRACFRSAILLLLLVFCAGTPEFVRAQGSLESPQLVTNAPASGTFYLLSRVPSAPYPFDPRHGTLPVYFYDGVYFVDDTQETSFELFGEGGGMMLMSSPSPPPSGTNSSSTNLVCCNTLTNFNVGYQFQSNTVDLRIAQSTNAFVDLIILTTNTSLTYDVFGTTNMVELAMPKLGRTNWTWLVRASGNATNFSWGLTNWCERYFQLGTVVNSDGDDLSDVFETLVSHTSTNNWDTDGDLVSDSAEWFQGRNPLVGALADTNGVLRLNVFTPLR